MLSTDVTGQFMNMLLCQGSFIQNKTVKSLSAVPGVKFHKNDKSAKRCLYVSFSAAHQNPPKKHAQSCSCTVHMCKHTLKYTNTHRLIERQSLSHEKCYYYLAAFKMSADLKQDPGYLWIYRFSCLSGLRIFLLSKCVFRRRRKRRRKRRRRRKGEMKMQSDRTVKWQERCASQQPKRSASQTLRRWYFRQHPWKNVP